MAWGRFLHPETIKQQDFSADSSSIDPQRHLHLFVDFIILILHIITTVTVELNFVTGKWSPALKINVSASPKHLFYITLLTVPRHLTCCGRPLSIHSVQFHLPHSSLMPHKIDISQSGSWRLNCLLLLFTANLFLKHQ